MKLSAVFKRRVKIMTVGSIAAYSALAFGMAKYLDVDKPDTVKTHATHAAVLTGGSDRVHTALCGLNHKDFNRLFISGVSSPKDSILYYANFKEGDHIEDDHTILRNSLELDSNAKNTHENAQEIAAWISRENLKEIVLITSSYHMKRAMEELKYELKNLDLKDVQIIPHIVGDDLSFPYFLAPSTIKHMTKEVFGLMLHQTSSKTHPHQGPSASQHQPAPF